MMQTSMQTVEKLVYTAEDGTQFDDKFSCFWYEAKCKFNTVDIEDCEALGEFLNNINVSHFIGFFNEGFLIGRKYANSFSSFALFSLGDSVKIEESYTPYEGGASSMDEEPVIVFDNGDYGDYHSITITDTASIRKIELDKYISLIDSSCKLADDSMKRYHEHLNANNGDRVETWNQYTFHLSHEVIKKFEYTANISAYGKNKEEAEERLQRELDNGKIFIDEDGYIYNYSNLKCGDIKNTSMFFDAESDEEDISIEDDSADTVITGHDDDEDSVELEFEEE